MITLKINYAAIYKYVFGNNKENRRAQKMQPAKSNVPRNLPQKANLFQKREYSSSEIAEELAKKISHYVAPGNIPIFYEHNPYTANQEILRKTASILFEKWNTKWVESRHIRWSIEWRRNIVEELDRWIISSRL